VVLASLSENLKTIYEFANFGIFYNHLTKNKRSPVFAKMKTTYTKCFALQKAGSAAVKIKNYYGEKFAKNNSLNQYILNGAGIELLISIIDSLKKEGEEEKQRQEQRQQRQQHQQQQQNRMQRLQDQYNNDK
jgi:hypothetical protein